MFERYQKKNKAFNLDSRLFQCTEKKPTSTKVTASNLATDLIFQLAK